MRRLYFEEISDVFKKYDLKQLKAGETDPNDALHRAANLNEDNLWRIQNTPKDGGGRKIWMKSKPVDLFDFTDKIKKEGGKTIIMAAINRRRMDMGIQGTGSANYKLCGLAVLDVINMRRRKGSKVQAGDLAGDE